MCFRFSCSWLILALSPWSPAWGQGVSHQTPPTSSGDSSSGAVKRVPSGVILVRGAWSSASDSVTPVPEGGKVVNHVFRDEYFGMTYALPPDWTEKYKGPPPSDGGRYVLAQLSPGDAFKGLARGSILITAQDLFFTTVPLFYLLCVFVSGSTTALVCFGHANPLPRCSNSTDQP